MIRLNKITNFKFAKTHIKRIFTIHINSFFNTTPKWINDTSVFFGAPRPAIFECSAWPLEKKNSK